MAYEKAEIALAIQGVYQGYLISPTRSPLRISCVRHICRLASRSVYVAPHITLVYAIFLGHLNVVIRCD